MNPLRNIHHEIGIAFFVAQRQLDAGQIPYREFKIIRDAYKTIQAHTAQLDLLRCRREADRETVFDLTNVCAFAKPQPRTRNPKLLRQYHGQETSRLRKDSAAPAL
jgi:hypothetical protein